MITGGDRFVRARRLRAHARLRVPQHRAEHRQLVPVRGGYQPAESADAFPLLQARRPACRPARTRTTLTRTVVGEDFRAPLADQFSLEFQRQLGTNIAMRVGYVGTLGKDLFQTIDGNPRLAVLWEPHHGPRVEIRPAA